eukprot:6268826-Prymnesium_polylepis.1
MLREPATIHPQRAVGVSCAARLAAPSQPQHATAALPVCQLGRATVAAAAAQAQQQPRDHGEAIRVELPHARRPAVDDRIADALQRR